MEAARVTLELQPNATSVAKDMGWTTWITIFEKQSRLSRCWTNVLPCCPVTVLEHAWTILKTFWSLEGAIECCSIDQIAGSFAHQRLRAWGCIAGRRSSSFIVGVFCHLATEAHERWEITLVTSCDTSTWLDSLKGKTIQNIHPCWTRWCETEFFY